MLPSDSGVCGYSSFCHVICFHPSGATDILEKNHSRDGFKTMMVTQAFLAPLVFLSVYLSVPVLEKGND